MTAQKFRKRPVVIEAMRLPAEPPFDAHAERLHAQDINADIAAWIVDNGGEVEDYGVNFIEIETLEGTMHASPEDWIIRGVAGEFYPCKPDVFAATYEPADTPVYDRDEIARVLYVAADFRCGECPPWEEADARTRQTYLHMADALIAFLTGARA